MTLVKVQPGELPNEPPSRSEEATRTLSLIRRSGTRRVAIGLVAAAFAIGSAGASARPSQSASEARSTEPRRISSSRETT